MNSWRESQFPLICSSLEFLHNKDKAFSFLWMRNSCEFEQGFEFEDWFDGLSNIRKQKVKVINCRLPGCSKCQFEKWFFNVLWQRYDGKKDEKNMLEWVTIVNDGYLGQTSSFTNFRLTFLHTGYYMYIVVTKYF